MTDSEIKQALAQVYEQLPSIEKRLYVREITGALRSLKAA
jgi:hypothetical protein